MSRTCGEDCMLCNIHTPKVQHGGLTGMSHVSNEYYRTDISSAPVIQSASLIHDPDSLLNELMEQGNIFRERLTLVEKQLADQQAYIENLIKRLSGVEKRLDDNHRDYMEMVAMERKADRLRGIG